MRLLQRVLLTPEGRDELTLEIACLEQTRREILNDARNAQDGNGRFRSELAAVDMEIARLKEVMTSGTVTDQTGLVVAVGSEVTVVDEDGEETFTIGGPLAANPRAQCISYESPLARAILGRELGETVKITSNEGRGRLKIVAIRRGQPGANQG